MPKAKKDPNKPKGVKSAYIFFVEGQRAERERSGKQLPFAELSKQCGVLWGDMDDTDKEKYVRLSDKDRKRHEHEMRSYIPPPQQDDSDSDSEDERPKKKKKTKDPNAPKRPTTAYFYFAAARRPEIREDMGALSVTEVATLIGQKWRELTDEDKIPYEEQAGKDKARYLKELAEYNKGR